MQLSADASQVKATQEAFPRAVARERVGKENLAVWVDNTSSWYEALEQLESDMFFDGQTLPCVAAGHKSRFLVIVGGPSSEHKVRHILRLAIPTAVGHYPEEVSFFVDDMISSGQGLTYSDLKAEYEETGVSLSLVPSIESSIRTESLTTAVSTSHLAYSALLAYASRSSWQGVFAHLNAPTRKSLKRVRIGFGPLSTRRALRTPKINGPGFDQEYEPQFLLLDGKTDAVLSRFGKFTPREVALTVS